MERKKKIEILLGAIIVISAIIYFFLKIDNSDTKDSKDIISAISDTSSYSDIIMFLENAKKENSILFEIPQENTLQDYNTYYGNEILRLLGEVKNDDIEKYANSAVCDENFMSYKNGDIFESIEKVYFLQKLADNCVENYYNENILEIVSGLVESSYDDSGFFYYAEFDDYLTDMTEKEIRTTRIYHTMMTLYLCKVYGLMDKLNVEAIEKYIKDSITTNDDVISLYYAYLCFEYLNCNTDFYAGQEICYDSDELDIMELNAYVSLMNELGMSIDKDIIVARMNAYVADCRVSNIMELFIAIDTLNKLDEPVSGEEKEKIVALLRLYQNADGTFPCISYYMLDNKQLLMYYQMTTKMGMESDLKEYQDLLSDDFNEQDYYDMYAYAYFASRLKMDTSSLERKLLNELSQCTLDNESSIGYILLALSELEINIKKENKKNNYIDEDVNNYIQMLISTETIEYNAQDLIMLYGFLKSGIIEINENIVTSLQKIDIENVESMQALVTYYKYEILALAEDKMDSGENIVDRTVLENILSKLRCEGGFKMNEGDAFIDLQATYYLIKFLE